MCTDMSSSLHAFFQRQEPQHASLLRGTRQGRATGVQGKPGHGSSASLCCPASGPNPDTSLPPAAGSFPQAGAASGHQSRGTPGALAPRQRPQHTVRFYGRGAACSPHNSWNAGCIPEGHPASVPNPRVSPQVNQDYNHQSKDRIVLFFPFFFFLKE